MTQQLAKPQHCVLIRSGLEIWIDSDRVPELEQALRDPQKRFLRIGGQLINSFEIIGVLDAKGMEERTRRKNGEWTCMKGRWHGKGEPCHCPDYKETVSATVDGVGPITYRR